MALVLPWVLLLSCLAYSSADMNSVSEEPGSGIIWPPSPPPFAPPPPSSTFDLVVISLIVAGLLALMCLVRVVWPLLACSCAMEEEAQPSAAAPVVVRLERPKDEESGKA